MSADVQIIQTNGSLREGGKVLLFSSPVTNSCKSKFECHQANAAALLNLTAFVDTGAVFWYNIN